MNAPERPTGFRGVVFSVLWLVIRGVLLWIVVPLAAITWLAFWGVMRANGIPLAQLIGWCDLNLVATIEQTILRPLTVKPYPWIPWSEVRTVTHRVGTADAA